VAHVAFKIPDFWPHDPNTWFRKMESKFRICNITQSSTTSPHDRRRERRLPSRPGRSRWKTPGPYKDDSDFCSYHTTYGNQARKCKPGCQWVPGTERTLKTKHSRRRHDFFTG
jgi:hypothetical protein